jgi:hypothetical protein
MMTQGLNRGNNKALFHGQFAIHGRKPIDPHVEKFMRRINGGRGGRLNEKELVSINLGTKELKSYNLWNKIICLYPFVGSSENSFSWNLKGPQYRMFVQSGTGIFDWTGSKNAIWRTGLFSGILPKNDLHLAFYGYDAGGGSGSNPDMGCYEFPGGIYIHQNSSGVGLIFHAWAYDHNYVGGVPSNTGNGGLQIMSRRTVSAGSFETAGFYRGVYLGSDTFAGYSQINAEIGVCGSYSAGNWVSGAPGGGKFASIGYSFTNAEALVYEYIIEKMQKTMGRSTKPV